MLVRKEKYVLIKKVIAFATLQRIMGVYFTPPQIAPNMNVLLSEYVRKLRVSALS